MPVDTKHPDYETMAPKWKRMRDASAGQDAIHGAGELYLPKLEGETPADYSARIKRTGWFNATWRTIEGLRGMLFRKDPLVVVSAASQGMLADVTKSGVDFDSFALKLAEEALTVGRVGVLVDYPATPADAPQDRALTVAEVQRFNLRPHLAMYTAEAIINWFVEWRNNRTELVKVVLEESATILKSDDEFTVLSEPRWRVLDLHPETGEYRVRVYRKKDGKDEQIGTDAYPLMNGKPLTFIPFRFIGTDDTTPQVDLPPLLDLANVNVGHYQTTADLEHGAHKTALPQPWIAGITPQMDNQGRPIPLTFYMGGSTVWTLDNPSAQVGMLEYTGAGLASLEGRLAVKEKHMAVLGARMLEAQKTGVEAAETAGIHRSGEHSALSAVAATISKAASAFMGWFDSWAGGDGNATVTINRKFFERQLSAQEVTAIVQGWQAGAISEQEMFELFQGGGVVRDDKGYEDHATEIANNPPMLMGGAGGLANATGDTGSADASAG